MDHESEESKLKEKYSMNEKKDGSSSGSSIDIVPILLLPAELVENSEYEL